jgi:hypothetical protein
LIAAIEENTPLLIDCAKPIDSHFMINSERTADPITLRPAWRGNLCLFLIVAAIVGGSVLFFLAY